MSDPAAGDLSALHVAGLLSTERLGRSYDFREVCSSTNDEAALRARDGAPEGLVVVADRQTGGRGRLGRVWHSPAGANLHVSLLLRPDGPPWELPPITLLVGAVAAGMLRAQGIEASLKWPNDVLLPSPTGPKKVAGILTEMASDRERIRHVVVGMGMNVNLTELPTELKDRATSLRLHTGAAWDRGALLASFLNALEPAYDRLLRQGPGAALDLWRPYAALGGRCRIERDGGVLVGVAVDVDPNGALLVRDDEGTIHRIVSGEIA